MNYAENARHLISRDELHDAFALLKMSIEDNEQRNSIILLESQLSNWENRFEKDPQLSLAERNRITFSILAIISEIEAQKRPTIKQQQQQVLETLLEKSFEKITEAEKPANMTDEALAKLEKASPDHLEQLKNLSVAFLASKNEHGDTLELIDFWQLQVKQLDAITAQDAKLMGHLLAESPSALIALINERRHRNASINLLEKRISDYKAKYDKLKTAGLATVAGMWLGSVLFNKRDGNIFGDDYDAKGYNAKGYDFDGFNKSGVDAEGHHFIEGLTDTELMIQMTIFWIYMITTIDKQSQN